MGKGSKADHGEWRRKVSPVQVALIVDRYLSENNYSNTLSLFRSEASILISQANGRKAPKSLLSLDAMLDEYICLKEQKVMLDQEKSRVDKLLQGMQNVMQDYSKGGTISPPQVAATTTMAPSPQTGPRNGPSAAGNSSNDTPTASLEPMLLSPVLDSTNFSTPTASLPFNNKRKASSLVSDESPAMKKSRAPSTAKGTKIPSKATRANAPSENVRQFSTSAVFASSVAKSLFKQHCQLQSPSPKTPPQAFASQNDESVSPIESSSLVHSIDSNTSQENTTCYPMNSSDAFVRSPSKRTGCHPVDGRHCASCSPLKLSQKRLNKRDHIKGRLDFDDSNMPLGLENEKSSTLDNGDEMSEIFDMDLSTFDAFGPDFSLSELLDTDIETQEMCPSFQQIDGSTDLIPGYKQESGNGGSGTIQSSSKPPLSSAKAVLSERDTNRQGPEFLTSVKSTMQSITIVSPGNIEDKEYKQYSVGEANSTSASPAAGGLGLQFLTHLKYMWNWIAIYYTETVFLACSEKWELLDIRKRELTIN